MSSKDGGGQRSGSISDASRSCSESSTSTPRRRRKRSTRGFSGSGPAALSTTPQASTASKSPSERSPISGDPLDILLSEVPLVGREPEMARLRTALESAVSGRGECVAIVGEAGVGKSRLVAELVAEAAQRGLRVLLGRCYENSPTAHPENSSSLVVNVLPIGGLWVRADHNLEPPGARPPGAAQANTRADDHRSAMARRRPTLGENREGLRHGVRGKG